MQTCICTHSPNGTTTAKHSTTQFGQRSSSFEGVEGYMTVLRDSAALEASVLTGDPSWNTIVFLFWDKPVRQRLLVLSQATCLVLVGRFSDVHNSKIHLLIASWTRDEMCRLPVLNGAERRSHSAERNSPIIQDILINILLF